MKPFWITSLFSRHLRPEVVERELQMSGFVGYTAERFEGAAPGVRVFVARGISTAELNLARKLVVGLRDSAEEYATQCDKSMSQLTVDLEDEMKSDQTALQARRAV